MGRPVYTNRCLLYNLELAKQECLEGYSVFDENGNVVN